jgi:ribonuclease Z
MGSTKLTFLGSADVLPASGRDTACFLIDGELLVDCGWSAVLRMRDLGVELGAIRTLFFTHCHHDHYMGLPALLFWRAILAGRGAEMPPLRIVGPPDDLPLVIELSRGFLQAERFPTAWPALELHPLEPGSAYEEARFRIETIRALHPVTAFSARCTDASSGVVIAFSGDTGPNPALVELAKGADCLIHEASIPPDRPDDAMRGDHSRATDAARAAVAAGVKDLRLIHLREDHRAASLAAAREIFPRAALAEDGETVEIATAGG